MKNVIITGAAGNLGKAVVEKFLGKGNRVLAVAREKSLPVHPNLEIFNVDLADESATSAFIQQVISKHKSIDAALMLAGGFAMGDIAATSENDLKQQIALNFETAYNIARPLFTNMLAIGYGRLIFVGARPALDANAGKNMIAYSLSKSLLFKLAENLNGAAKGNDVTATVIVPSTIDTPANRESMPNANPNNWVKPSQIAALAEMICSEQGASLRETVLKVYGNS